MYDHSPASRKMTRGIFPFILHLLHTKTENVDPIFAILGIECVSEQITTKKYNRENCISKYV
jgi:hypothetical protein